VHCRTGHGMKIRSKENVPRQGKSAGRARPAFYLFIFIFLILKLYFARSQREIGYLDFINILVVIAVIILNWILTLAHHLHYY
jgi:hypothetical protein